MVERIRSDPAATRTLRNGQTAPSFPRLLNVYRPDNVFALLARHRADRYAFLSAWTKSSSLTGIRFVWPPGRR